MLRGRREKKKYYLRAIELFTKVLSLDSKNVYAAQGLAITYIENKQLNKGLDILRKIRDSLNDISVYLNLGHVLCDLKQFGKAIENYELALTRYTDGKDAKILSFLGRVWYLRGNAELSLPYLKKALGYAQAALDAARSTSTAALAFNISFVQFQIADFITKQPVNERNVEDIESAIEGLNKAIDILTQLASDEEKHPPYPREELRGRANLGTSTLLSRLANALEETKENNAEIEEKIQKAKQIRLDEEQARLKEEEERLNKLKEKELEMSKQRMLLQEQAQKWAEENSASVGVSDNEEDDDKLFDEESAQKENKKRKEVVVRERKAKAGKERKYH